jgi:hypothetical protein
MPGPMLATLTARSLVHQTDEIARHPSPSTMGLRQLIPRGAKIGMVSLSRSRVTPTLSRRTRKGATILLPEVSSAPLSDGLSSERFFFPHPEDQVHFRPREDRADAKISTHNAQALLSPSACVFVAKSVAPGKHPPSVLTSISLNANLSDDELQSSVTRFFSKFGKCWPKIRRDPKNMPYAFIQFEVSCP